MKPKKVISLLLVASLSLGALPGCISAEEVKAPMGETSSAIETMKPQSYKTLAEYYAYLESLPSKNTQEVLNTPEEYTSEEIAKAAYDNLKGKGIDINDDIIQNEFNNILAYSMYPTGLSEAEYEFAVGNLDSTLTREQNPFICYYPIALTGHTLTCGENHTTNEFGKTECPVIIELWKSFGNQSIEEELDKLYSEDAAYRRIKSAIIITGFSINDYVTELECLAYQAQNPESIYDEELSNNIYNCLNATLKYGENVYNVYAELAVSIHNTLFTEEPLEVPNYLKQAR